MKLKHIALVLTLVVFGQLILLHVSYADEGCQQVGSEPLSCSDVQGLIGDPDDWQSQPWEQACCCYDNEFIFRDMELDLVVSGFCCDEEDPNCYTEYYVTYYDCIPTARENVWNVDNDNDNVWDHTMFAYESWNGICFCGGGFAGCYPDPQTVKEAPDFVCESCNN